MSRRRNKSSISIVDKLINREVTGVFSKNGVSPDNKAVFLFGSIPARLHFHMKSVIKDMGRHIFMGMSQCGTFLITYTFSFGYIRYRSSFRYNLHFWLYSPGSYAILVDEVILFQGYDVRHTVDIQFAQWPSLLNKILVYGQSDTNADQDATVFITIASLPSRSKCFNCVSEKSKCGGVPIELRRCLKHGLTVHTMFNIVSPFPPVNISIALKDENCFVINAGNFIHVLSVDLNEPAQHDTISNNSALLKHNIGIDLIPWGYKVPASTKKYLNNAINYVLYKKEVKRKIAETAENGDNVAKTEYSATKKLKYQSKSFPLSKQAQLKQVANKVYDFADTEDGCNLKFKWFRRRTIADKMYEYCSDEEDMENVHPFKKLKERTLSNATKSSSVSSADTEDNIIDKILLDIESIRRKNNVEKNNLITKDSAFSNCNIKNSRNDLDVENRKNNYLKTVCPKLSPLNINCENSSNNEFETAAAAAASLSPKSDISYSTVSSDCSEHWWKFDIMEQDTCEPCSKDDSNVIVRGIGKKFPNLCLNKFFLEKSHMRVVLKPSNPDINSTIRTLLALSDQCSKCYSKTGNQKSRISNSKGNKYIRQNISGCSLNFERYYREYGNIDYSTVPIETTSGYDDEGNEFQGALPLLVLGAATSQMHLVPYNEVEKLRVPYCTVRQDSLDIEQFCYKAAEIVCKCEGYKFWFCSDYDVEIVDICPLNGDILAVVFMKINAEPDDPQNNDQSTTSDPSIRKCYEFHCIFTWNAKLNECWLEVYFPLAEPQTQVGNWNPAKDSASKLRLMKLGFFSVPLMRPVRFFNHRTTNVFGGSLKVIEDEFNMISFYRDLEDDDRNDIYDVDEDDTEDDSDYEHRDLSV